MLKNYFALLCILFSGYTFSQGDNCSTASALPVNIGCSFTSGTSLGATQSFAGCAGNADDDVWYSFVATLTSHSITLTSSVGYDGVFEVFSGSCGSLSSIVCVDNFNIGITESTMLTGLTPGNTYYIRVYDYFAGSGSNTFNICVSSPPAAPANDICTNATSVTVNSGCSYINSTSYGATQSMAGCSGTSDDDVWFKFTANNYTQTIQVAGSANFDAVLQVLAGACGAQTSLYCIDNTFSGGTESVVAVGLTPGTVYFIRVHDYYSTGGGTFSVCVSGNPISLGSQPNDNPCSATLLPPVTSNCNYLQFSNVGATSTPTTLVSAPASCAGGGSPFMGGYNVSTADVWFQITVPASGNIYITPQPNLGSGFISDGVMALYSGPNCSALTQISCSDDYTLYPGGGNDLLPYIAATGLPANSIVYLRYWGFSTSTGSFGICVQSPTNDNCSNALNICDLNGYSGSTSAAYSADRPCNMHGNNETLAGVDQPNGTNTGGIFGQGGPWGVGSPSIDVNINNNSWIRFTAALPNASFKINIANCWVGSYPSGGIQMQIFSALSACCNFTPVSDFKEGSSTFTINANGLTVGANYYLMIDGFAGDICNYTITALSGVSFPNIAATATAICPGTNVTLTGPASASSYTWLPSGLNTNTISVSPGSNITYTLIAGGVCGYKQTLTRPIIVNPLPNVLINSGNPLSICNTQTINLTASGASTYTWNTGSNAASISVSPSGNTNYTVTGTSAQGCVNSTVTTLTVNALPNTTIAASSNTICSGSTATLTASGASTYTWNTGPTTATLGVSPPSATIYTVTGSTPLGCTRTATVNVGVNGLPTINTTSANVCSGSTATLIASGGVSYLWSNSTNTSTNAVTPTTNTFYTVVGTGTNGCTRTATASVNLIALPNITVNSTTLCNASTATLLAGGANTYTWNNNANGPSISVTPTTTSNYTVLGTAVTGCTNVAVATITVFPRPSLNAAPTLSPSNCGGSTGSITAVNVTGVPTFTYVWTNGNNVQVGNTANLLNQPAGTYNLQVKDGNNCINNFGPYSIINPGAPSAPAALASSTSICSGAVFSLSATSPATQFNWSGPNGFSSINANTVITSSSAGTLVYSVFSTSAGCSGPATNVTVVVNSLPTPVANVASSTLCAGATINLFSSTSFSYNWSGPNGFQSAVQNPTITGAGTNASGIYSLIVSSAASCTGNTTVSVTVNGNPTITAFATNSSVCTGAPIVLNASGGNSYNWQGPNGYSASGASATIATSSTLSAGNYSVNVTNTNGCNSSTVIAINVNLLPTFSLALNSNSVCTNSPIILMAGGPGALTYSWTGPNSYNATGSTQTINPASSANAGNYSVTATNSNNCKSSGNISVFIYSLTPVTLSTSTNGTTNCTGNTINLLSNTNGNGYLWQGPNSFTSSLQNPSIQNAVLAASGVYSLTVTDANNCKNTNTLNLTVNQTPSLVNSNGGLTCVAQNIILSANFGSGANVSWFDDLSLTAPLLVNSNTFVPNFTSFGTYTFYAQGNLNGCTSSVTPIVANYYNVVSSFNTSTLTGGVPLLVNFTNTSVGLTNSSAINWTFGDGNTSNQDTPNNTFQNPGTYTVQLIVDNGLCKDTSDVIIVVNVVNVEVPEVFTPNGDLYNQAFEIKGLQYFPNNELYIYNRWGNIVYSMKGYDNKWEGIPNTSQKTGSDKLPTGTYYYLLKLNDDKQQVYKGYVQLMY